MLCTFPLSSCFLTLSDTAQPALSLLVFFFPLFFPKRTRKNVWESELRPSLRQPAQFVHLSALSSGPGRPCAQFINIRSRLCLVCRLAVSRQHWWPIDTPNKVDEGHTNPFRLLSPPPPLFSVSYRIKAPPPSASYDATDRRGKLICPASDQERCLNAQVAGIA